MTNHPNRSPTLADWLLDRVDQELRRADELMSQGCDDIARVHRERAIKLREDVFVSRQPSWKR